MTENQIELSVRRNLVDNKILGSVAYRIVSGTKLRVPFDGYYVEMNYLDNGVATRFRRGMKFSYMDSETLERSIAEMIMELKKEAEKK